MLTPVWERDQGSLSLWTCLLAPCPWGHPCSHTPEQGRSTQPGAEAHPARVTSFPRASDSSPVINPNPRARCTNTSCTCHRLAAHLANSRAVEPVLRPELRPNASSPGREHHTSTFLGWSHSPGMTCAVGHRVLGRAVSWLPRAALCTARLQRGPCSGAPGAQEPSCPLGPAKGVSCFPSWGWEGCCQQRLHWPHPWAQRVVPELLQAFPCHSTKFLVLLARVTAT